MHESGAKAGDAQDLKLNKENGKRKWSHLLKDRLVVIHVIHPDNNLRGGRQGLGSA